MKGRDGISRAVSATAKGRRVVVVRVFVKKTQRTPRREIGRTQPGRRWRHLRGTGPGPGDSVHGPHRVLELSKTPP